MAKNGIFFGFLLTIGLILYFNTFTVPWYFDDIDNIVGNDRIKNIGVALSQIFENRGFSYFTFSINHYFGGLKVFGYHIFNILIHVSSAFLVYLILKLLDNGDIKFAAIGSLIFLCHPIQTQSVTYIVQRMSSMSGFFYLSTVLFYLLFRHGSQENSIRNFKFYYISILSAVFAALTKENSATIPFLLASIEFLDISNKGGAIKDRLKFVIPFLCVPIFLIFQQFLVEKSTLHAIQQKYFYLESPDGSGGQFSFLNTDEIRHRLLFTQFIVIWKYVRLFFIPYGQMLDYGYPVVLNIFNIKSITGLFAIAASLMLALKLRKSNKLISFGIIWFFVTLSTEASIFPLDCVYEHRLYLPAFGLILILLEFLSRLTRQKVLALISVILIAGLGYLTVLRNDLWASPVSFWSDNVQKAPHNFRAKSHLAKALEEAGLLKEALSEQMEVVGILPSQKNYTNLGRLYIKNGDLPNAKSVYEFLIKASPGNSYNYVNYSIVTSMMGDSETALAYAKKAYALAPQDENVLAHLGLIYSQMRDVRNAELFWRRALTVNPNNSAALAGISRLSTVGGR